MYKYKKNNEGITAVDNNNNCLCLFRYFQMVVGLYAVVKDESFPLTALVSEKIIVRVKKYIYEPKIDKPITQ